MAFHTMPPFRSLLRVVVLLCFLAAFVEGQYYQGLTTIGGNTYWDPFNDGVTSFTVRSAPPAVVTTTITTTRADDGSSVVITGTSPSKSIPTLVYNCHWMPYICRNVANWMTTQGETWDQGRLALVADTVSNSLVQGTLDKSERRKEFTCGAKSSLYKGKTNNFPAQCAAVSSDTIKSNLGDFQPDAVPNQPSWIAGSSSDEPSGLLWTCDEFPSSSWIRGGRGLRQGGGTRGPFTGQDAAVICAPQGVGCSRSARRGGGLSDFAGMEQMINALNSGNPSQDQKNLLRNRSEQDWQSNALISLKECLHRLHDPPAQPGVPRVRDYAAYFHLSTTTDAALQSKAWVIDELGNTRSVMNKRAESTELPDKDEHWRRGEAVTTIALPKRTPTSAEAQPTKTEPPRHPINFVTPRPYAAFIPPKPMAHRLRGRDVDDEEIREAQALIKKYQVEMRESNLRKMAHPRVWDERKMMKGSRYRDFSGARRLLMREVEQGLFGPINATVPFPTEEDYKPVNDTIKAAAALLAEYSANHGGLNLTLPTNSSSDSRNKEKRQASSYWLPQMTHGKSPFNPTPDYQVWRNVQTDCGAAGDGVTDDTEAIQDCISRQDRCGADCGTTSVAGAIIYFPEGTYLVSSTILMYYYTQVIGDANNRPVIVAAPSFSGLGVLSSNYYIPDAWGDQWYINQSNFLRQVRNLVIDTRNCPFTQIAAIHWQVAQGSSLQDLELVLPTDADNNAVGMFMENGSGGMFGDVTFRGGFIGKQCGNQQFTTRNVVFENCPTAITSFWDWGWVWKSLTITGSEIAMNIIPDEGDPSAVQQTYSYLILDSTISAGTGVLTYPWSNRPSTGITQLTLDNVDFSGTGDAIRDTSGNVILAGGQTINSWALGTVFTPASPSGQDLQGSNIVPTRNPPTALRGGPNGGYFERSKPQYQDVPASSFTNALDAGCAGDGITDDTDCLNTLFSSPGYVFLPAGVYLATDTVRITSGMKIVGEMWSQIMAYGENFEDMDNPRVLVQVGEPGETGDVEMQDLMFTVKGATAGAILLRWDLRASGQGVAAMWDCHFRVGGNLGSELQVGDCPKNTGSINPDCISANMLFHLTSWGSGYFENVWGWVADHDLDIEAQTQIDIFVGRGALIESVHPTWMYGTSMEHCVLYQYQLYGARNLFMAMIQTESPYFQSVPKAPTPFESAVGQFAGDPNYSECDRGSSTCAKSWGLRVERTEDVLIYGAGLYSWFQDYDQSCLPFLHCQDRMVFADINSRFFLFNLVTVGTRDMVTAPGTGVRAPANTFNDKNSNTSSFNAFLMQANWRDIGQGEGGGNGTDLPGATITLPQSFWWPAGTTPGTVHPITGACSSPCVFIIPPFTLPVIQPPAFTTSWSGTVHTVTPPMLVNATYSINPIHWGTIPPGGITTTDSEGSTVTVLPPGVITITTTDPQGSTTTTTSSPEIHTGSTTTSGQVTIITPSSDQTEIILPPIITRASGEGSDVTIQPPPIPIPWPSHRGPGCLFMCDGQPPRPPPLVVQPGPPPGPPPPRPPPRGQSEDNQDPDDEDDDDDDDDEEEEEEACPYFPQDDFDIFEIPDEDGNTISSGEGAGSASGGSVGQGGIDGSGAGYLDDDGNILSEPPDTEPNVNDPGFTSTTSTTTSSTTTTTTTTSTTSTSTTIDLPYPTGTSIQDNDALCYEDSNRLEQLNYRRFSIDDVEDLIVPFCEADLVLEPDDDDGLQDDLVAGSLRVNVDVRWADNQSGCGTKANLHLSYSTGIYDPAACVIGFTLVFDECEGVDDPPVTDERIYGGGGYVLDTGTGCVLIRMWAAPASSTSSSDDDSGGSSGNGSSGSDGSGAAGNTFSSPDNGRSVRNIWKYVDGARRIPLGWDVAGPRGRDLRSARLVRSL